MWDVETSTGMMTGDTENLGGEVGLIILTRYEMFRPQSTTVLQLLRAIQLQKFVVGIVAVAISSN